MLRPARISRAPLLPVKPERYRRLGLKATSRQSSLRSGSAAATLCRRSSYWLFSTLQFLGEDLGPLGQRIRLARVVVLLGFFGERQEIPDGSRHALLRSEERRVGKEGRSRWS